jgi:hypothetical protein
LQHHAACTAHHGSPLPERRVTGDVHEQMIAVLLHRHGLCLDFILELFNQLIV